MKPLTRIKSAVALSVALVPLMSSPPVSADVARPPQPTTPATSTARLPQSGRADAQLVRDYVRISATLLKSNAPRTIEQVSGDFRLIAFHLDGLDFAALFYKNRAVLDTSGTGSSEVVSPQISVGVDSLGPYIRLNSSEQAAAANGAAWVIVAAICSVSGGSLSLIAGAIAAAVVGVISANGVCSGSHAMHVYWWRYYFRCE